MLDKIPAQRKMVRIRVLGIKQDSIFVAAITNAKAVAIIPNPAEILKKTFF